MGKKIRSDRPAEKQGGRTADFCYGFLKRIIGENLHLVGAFAHTATHLTSGSGARGSANLCSARTEVKRRPTERRLFCRITETDKLYPCIEIDFHVECKSDQISHRRFLECLRLMTII